MFLPFPIYSAKAWRWPVPSWHPYLWWSPCESYPLLCQASSHRKKAPHILFSFLCVILLWVIRECMWGKGGDSCQPTAPHSVQSVNTQKGWDVVWRNLMSIPEVWVIGNVSISLLASACVISLITNHTLLFLQPFEILIKMVHFHLCLLF